MHNYRSILLVVAMVASPKSLADPAAPVEQGTWSIAAVDRSTGEVGIAGASCTYNVQGIGEVIPGIGVVVVQGMSSDEAREHGIKQLGDGASPSQVVAAMCDQRFDPANQQYAVVSLRPDHPAATFSGKLTDSWRGSATGDGVSVQGNSLVSEEVVKKALTSSFAFMPRTGWHGARFS